ncbi:hypothetical protein [Burkholderia vietnamiensis]|uniref:hypothetical protein n=1 Tax=Burkholderia vietnamiensis TaxID=60552 RepID=UPI001CF5374E|nr:hypothetical protein [Burkholderia vietnamiensis]MCA8198467.1 hypothetical protein [Burkholderia vietnamiensis]
MATLQQIDRTKALSFSGYRTVKLTDPEMVALAARLQLPQMLNSDEPVADGKEIAPEDAARILDRMADSAWCPIFEADLQCMSEDAEGRPFLTTWLSLEQFRRFLDCIADMPVHSGLAIALAEWESKGAQKIYFDGYQTV